jgi:hypothetical protein
VLAGLPFVWQVASGAKAMWVRVDLAEPALAAAGGWGRVECIDTLREVSAGGFRIVETTLLLFGSLTAALIAVNP